MGEPTTLERLSTYGGIISLATGLLQKAGEIHHHLTGATGSFRLAKSRLLQRIAIPLGLFSMVGNGYGATERIFKKKSTAGDGLLVAGGGLGIGAVILSFLPGSGPRRALIQAGIAFCGILLDATDLFLTGLQWQKGTVTTDTLLLQAGVTLLFGFDLRPVPSRRPIPQPPPLQESRDPSIVAAARRVLDSLPYRGELLERASAIGPELVDDPLRTLNLFLRGELGREPRLHEARTLAAHIWKLLPEDAALWVSRRIVRDRNIGEPIFEVYTQEFLDATARYIRIVADDFVRTYRRLPRIVEIAAGDGRFTKGLNRRLSPELQITATDLGLPNCYGVRPGPHVKIQDGYEAAVEADILLGAWWPDEQMDYQIARLVAKRPEKTLILVGMGYTPSSDRRTFWGFAASGRVDGKAPLHCTEPRGLHMTLLGENLPFSRLTLDRESDGTFSSVFRSRRTTPPPDMEPIPSTIESLASCWIDSLPDPIAVRHEAAQRGLYNPPLILNRLLAGCLGREPSATEVQILRNQLYQFRDGTLRKHLRGDMPGGVPIYQIFTHEFLDKLAGRIRLLVEEFRSETGRDPRIVEIAAGSGALTAGLNKRIAEPGIRIRATDDGSWKSIPPIAEVKRVDALTAAREADIVIGSWWPLHMRFDAAVAEQIRQSAAAGRGAETLGQLFPLTQPWDARVAKEIAGNPGKRLVLIHGPPRGPTNSRQFWDLIESREGPLVAESWDDVTRDDRGWRITWSRLDLIDDDRPITLTLYRSKVKKH